MCGPKRKVEDYTTAPHIESEPAKRQKAIQPITPEALLKVATETLQNDPRTLVETVEFHFCKENNNQALPLSELKNTVLVKNLNLLKYCTAEILRQSPLLSVTEKDGEVIISPKREYRKADICKPKYFITDKEEFEILLNRLLDYHPYIGEENVQAIWVQMHRTRPTYCFWFRTPTNIEDWRFESFCSNSH